MAVPNLTSAEWRLVRRRVIARCLELTKRAAKARELADAAIARSLEPDMKGWDPDKHKDFGDYLCDLAWSRYGNEITSYRVVKASFDLGEADDSAAPSSRNPERLTLAARETARAERQHAAVHRRIQGDALIMLLMERDSDMAALEPSGYGPGNEMPAPTEQGEDEEAPRAKVDTPEEPRRPNAEAASTRRALAKGYTAKEIEAARKRLKRHAEAVAREERSEEP